MSRAADVCDKTIMSFTAVMTKLVGRYIFKKHSEFSYQSVYDLKFKNTLYWSFVSSFLLKMYQPSFFHLMTHITMFMQQMEQT